MLDVIVVPELVTSAAEDMAALGSAITTANAAAAESTTGAAAMAADEVSTAINAFFHAHAQMYRELSAEATASLDQFVRALAATESAYVATEVANASALQGLPRAAFDAANASTRALMGGSLLGSRATSATGGAAGGTGTLTSTAARPLVSGPTTALIMGPTGYPLLPPNFIADINTAFIQRLYPGAAPLALFVPNQAYPITGVMSLTIDASIAQGVTNLHTAITQQLNNANHVVVFGYSQSAVVSSMEMRNLAALPPADRPSTSELSFILVGDPANPNGGLFERFSGLNMSSFGLTMSGATPDNVYPTTIYTREYDGFADFPRYPINVLADVNAFAGMLYAHQSYQSLTPEQIASAIPLPTDGTTQTEYYMIPTPNLPLLAPLRQLPIIGTPLADLIEPDLTVIINLGYGDPAYGYSTGPANVPTPFGLVPHVDPQVILADLVTGTQQGINAASHDISVAGGPTGFPSLPAPSLPQLWNAMTSNPGSGNWATSATDQLHNALIGSEVALANPAQLMTNFGADLQAFTTHVQVAMNNATNTLTTAATTGVAALLPTASLAFFFGVTLPTYNLSLMLDGLKIAMAGNPAGLVQAIGYPIAADPALAILATGIYLDYLAGVVGIYPFFYEPLRPY
jgi:hypothetical protein